MRALRRLRPLLTLIGVGLSVLAAPLVNAQSEGLLQIEGDLERFLLRQHVQGHLPSLDPGALPLSTAAGLALLDSLDAAPLPPTDRRLAASFQGRTTGGLFGERVAARTPLYPDGRSFGRVAGDGYGLELAPLVNASFGPAYINRLGAESEWGQATLFSRGLRGAGHVGRLFAEARVTENQALVPLGDRPTTRTAPRLGWVKTSGDVDPTYDYLLSTGIIGYRDRFVELRAGRDRNRWGFARGALLLSNYAAEYDHAQLRIEAGPVSVQSLYARFLDPRPVGVSDGTGVVEQRYGVFHRVAYRPGAGVELELFESVIFGDQADDNRNGFEPAYLVPFALYRAVERDLGSPDNVLLGGGAAWRFARGARGYYQFLLDELTAGRFFEDAWTNKWGVVLGLQLADPVLPVVGRLSDTDLQIEYARLRPYLYAHRAPVTAAIHYGDGLGHPAGPNASDLSIRLAHRPHADVELSLDAAYTVRGRDTETENFGSDPSRPYTDRVPEPNPTLQGVRQRLAWVDARASVRLLPDAFAGLSLQAWATGDAADGGSGVVTPQAFLRWGLPAASPRY